MAALCTGVQLNLIAEPFVAFSKAIWTRNFESVDCESAAESQRSWWADWLYKIAHFFFGEIHGDKCSKWTLCSVLHGNEPHRRPACSHQTVGARPLMQVPMAMWEAHVGCGEGGACYTGLKLFLHPMMPPYSQGVLKSFQGINVSVSIFFQAPIEIVFCLFEHYPLKGILCLLRGSLFFFDSIFLFQKVVKFQVKVAVLLYWSWVPKMLCHWWLLQPPTRTVTTFVLGESGVKRNIFWIENPMRSWKQEILQLERTWKKQRYMQSFSHGIMSISQTEQLPCLVFDQPKTEFKI